MSSPRPDRAKARKVSPNAPRRAGSSAEVGSSMSSSSGSRASARAIATRCASPPDRCPGSASTRASTPMLSSSPRATVSARSRVKPSAWMGDRVTLSRTERCSKSACAWNTMPTVPRSVRKRDSGSSAPGSSVTLPTVMEPALNGCSAAMERSTVVLPAPETPIRAHISPAAISMSSPVSTRCSPRLTARARTFNTALTRGSTVLPADGQGERVGATSRDRARRTTGPVRPNFRCWWRRSPSAWSIRPP